MSLPATRPFTPPPFIASLADVQRISAGPVADYMPHRRVRQGLAQAAAWHAGRVALTGIDSADPAAPPRRWTYAELLRDLTRAANLFHALVAPATPRVALLLPPLPETHLALWGAESAGIACPINFQLDREHLAALLRAAGANILVQLGPAPDLDIATKAAGLQAQVPTLRHVLHVAAGPDAPLPAGLRSFVAELAAQRGDALDFDEAAAGHGDLAALFHTGGTTGAPKLAQHTQLNQLHAAWGAACMFGTRPGDVMLNGFPLFHVAGAFVYGLSTLLAGGQLVLPTRLGLRHAGFMQRFGDFVQQHGVTLLAGVPTVMAGLLALKLRNEQLGTVRAMLTGGSPLPTELAAAFEERHGVPVRNILGMTESAGVISIEPLQGPRTAGSCGLPLPFTELQVRRGDGTLAAPGESGILRVRGPHVSPGYTDAARNPGTFEQGWLISGDIAHRDDAGRVFVTGRAKDVIIRGAHNIDPGLIEGVLLRHPAVLMAAAVGEPDAYAGELPVAYVSLKPGASATAEEIAAFAAPLIPERPAVPRRVEIVPSIPTTAVGKVYKPALRVKAVQQALQAQLDQRGLTPQVSVSVQDTAAGLAVCFELNAAGNEATETAVRELMKPYALVFTLRPRSAA